MLNREFAVWVLVAFLGSIASTVIKIKIWLTTFASRTMYDWWIFALIVIIAMLISFLTVSGQNYKARGRILCNLSDKNN
jgi:hypothetical protein